MLLVQFHGGLFIRSDIESYSCIRELRGTTNSMSKKWQNLGSVNWTPQNLAQLRKDFNNISLVSFDRWGSDRHVTTTWQKNDIKRNKYYQWPEYLLGGLVDTKPSSYATWLVPKYKAAIFQEDVKTDLTKEFSKLKKNLIKIY